MPKVLIADKMDKLAAEIFQNNGIEIDIKPGLSPEELAQIAGQYDGIAARSSAKITSDVISASLPRLKVIGRAGIGVDTIDVPAATQAGVVVMNTPFGNSITTAEHAIAMMFAIARQIPQASESTHAGKWEKSRFMGVELYGKTLGIVGCGNIGSIVASRALGLQMKVIAFDPFLTEDRAREIGVEKAELEEVIKRVVEECEICQRFKRSNQLFHTLSTTIADGPWELLQIDLATSLPTSTSGNNYLLIVVDTFSRFVVLHALPDKSATSTAQALLKTIASYGLPESIQTDEGKEFHNALWRDIFAALHMQHREPSAYTSRQQGAAERNVQIVVDAVRMELDGANTSWDVVLPSVQYSVNNRFCAPIATTPFTVLFGRPAAPTETKDDRSWSERSHELKEVLYPALKQRLQIVHQRQNETFGKRHLTQEKSLALGTEVVLLDPTRENKMAPPYVGNYTIGQKDNLGRYFLFDSDGNLHPGAVDISRLKLVRRPLVPADVTHRSYTIERILDLRGPPNAREYKVKWAHDRTPTWEPHSNFVDIKMLDDFEHEWSARRRNNNNNNERPRRR